MARVPALLKGADRPANLAEGDVFGHLCHDQGLHVAAANIWASCISAGAAFGHRYNAACSAALAGTGAGKDEPRPDDAAKAQLRRQALEWLTAELTAWSARLTSYANTGPEVVAQLRHWTTDSDLAGVRDPDALAKLPEAERKVWQALWDDVERLRRRALVDPRFEVKPE